MKPANFFYVPAVAAAFSLTSCQEDLQPEIDRLNAELADIRAELEDERARRSHEEEEAGKLHDELADMKSELSQAQRDARDFERELTVYQKREEAERAAEEAKPDAKELLAAAKETAQKHTQAKVTIEGDANSGSGIVVATGDKHWIYLSPATLSGNSRLEITQASGTPLKKFGAFEIMEGGAVARLEITEEPDHAVPLAGPSELSSSTRLLAFDDAGSLLEGRAYNVEDASMRVDSRIGTLPVGTPVFLADSGDLIGILSAEAAAEATLWPSTYGSTRRQTHQCLRLDPKTTWSSLAIGGFLEEAKVLDETNQLTRLLATFAIVRPTSGGINFETTAGGGMSVKEVFAAHKDESAVRSMMDLDQWLKDKGDRAAPQDLNRRVKSVYSEIQRLSARQTKEFAEHSFSAYHAPAAKLAAEWRKKADEDIAKTVSTMD